MESESGSNSVVLFCTSPVCVPLFLPVCSLLHIYMHAFSETGLEKKGRKNVSLSDLFTQHAELSF